MTLIRVLPQELLFNICEYSDVVPETLSNEYILQEILNLHPMINLGRELLVANTHRFKDDLFGDLCSIVSVTASHDGDVALNTVGEQGNDYYIAIDQFSYSSKPRKYKRIYKSLLGSYFKSFSVSMVSKQIRMICTVPEITSDELTLMYIIARDSASSVHRLLRSSNERSRCGEDHIITKLAEADRNISVYVIEELRKIPGCISNIIRYSRMYRTLMDNAKLKGCPVNEFMARRPKIIDVMTFTNTRGRKMRIAHNAQADISNITSWIVDRLSIPGVTCEEDKQFNEVFITVPSGGRDVVDNIVSDLRLLMDLSVANSITYEYLP
uniref:Uncharacterized protein n=1 Tax=viral metagenome TaxID=1070528 RepID=A0A6C0BLK8_9ZZZZ